MKNKKAIRDLTGQTFGRLTVMGLKETETRKTYWMCQCDCGNVKSVRSDSLLCGAIRSCGCLKKAQDRINLTKHHSHKMSGTRIYHTWQGMKGRCYNTHDARYSCYGGRGISVCDEWRADFAAFYKWSLENGYNDTLTIDRIDNDGDYSPSNCRWATQQEQSRNRRTNIAITIGNSTRTLTEWCEIFGLNYSAVHARYQRGNFDNVFDLFNFG